jgi:putative membrane protein
MPSDAQVEVRALHPVSMLIGVPLAQLIRTLVVPTAALLAGGRDASTVLLLLLLGIGAVVRVLAWQRFRWSFDGRTVRVDSGVLRRTRRSVGVERIQQVEIDRPLVQRLLGMATLRLETAGSAAGPEVELRVLRHADALALQRALQPESRSESPSGPSPDSDAGTATPGPSVRPVPASELVLRLPVGRVALAAVTGAQLLLAPAVLLGALQLLGDGVNEGLTWMAQQLEELLLGGERPSAFVWTALLTTTAVVMVATTLVVGVVRDGAYEVRRVDEDLVVRRGLLGTRTSVLPLRRLQVLRIVANPLRRLLGVSSVRIHSAGGSGSGERRIVIPLVRDTELPELVRALLGSDIGDLPELTRNPSRARRRSIIRRLLDVTTLGVPVAITLLIVARVSGTTGADASGSVGLVLTRPLLSVLVALALLVTAVGLGVLDHRARAHGLTRHLVVVRAGALTRTTDVAPRARLQAVSTRASLLQARRALATVVAHVAGPGGDVAVVDLDATVGAALHAALADSASGAPTTGPFSSPRAA